MSTYGSMPPSDPDAYRAPGQGESPAYSAAPGGPAYGQPAYGQPAYGEGFGAPAPGAYASWLSRVGARVIDSLVPFAILIVPGIIGSALSAASESGTSGVGVLLILLGYAAAIAFSIWNLAIREGRTGQSIGKKVLGITVLKEADGRPMGAGLAFGRMFVHIIDSFCMIGYLLPLFDAKKQTFTDKILATVVVRA